MANQFCLKNLKDILKKDTFYRLDFVTGLDLTIGYQTHKKFTTIQVNFCEYASEYQDLKLIKSIPIKDRFKNSINGKKVIVSTEVVAEDLTNFYILKSGSVWKNGMLIWEPSDSNNIEINQDSKVFTNFKSESEFQKFPFIKDSNHSNLIKFPNSVVNGISATVLIPAMEIIRYYYTGSRYFTTMLFNGGMEDDQFKSAFVYKYGFNPDNGYIYIWLRRKCYDSDAVLLARSIANKDAKNAMRLIYSSLISVIAHYERNGWKPLNKCCPKSALPFGDKAEMEVQGQWLPPNENGEFVTYLVRAIDKCNHLLPFTTIEIESVDSYTSSNNKSNELKPHVQKNIYRDDEAYYPMLTEGLEPTQNIKAQELEFYTDRFNHLSEIDIHKVSKTSDKDMETYQKLENVDSLSDEGSTQTGNYQQGNNLEPWEIMVRDGESIPISKRLSLTAEAVKSISEDSQLSVTPLPAGSIDGSEPYGFYDFKKPYGKSYNYTWSFIGDRKRKALFLEISRGQSNVFLLEIEGKNKSGHSLYLLSQPKVPGSSYKREFFLQEIADKSGNGIISNIFYRDFTIVTSLKHTTNGDDSFSERLSRSLIEALSDQL